MVGYFDCMRSNFLFVPYEICITAIHSLTTLFVTSAFVRDAEDISGNMMFAGDNVLALCNISRNALAPLGILIESTVATTFASNKDRQSCYEIL